MFLENLKLKIGIYFNEIRYFGCFLVQNTDYRWKFRVSRKRALYWRRAKRNSTNHFTENNSFKAIEEVFVYVVRVFQTFLYLNLWHLKIIAVEVKCK
jgi:hypothetical protein